MTLSLWTGAFRYRVQFLSSNEDCEALLRQAVTELPKQTWESTCNTYH